MGTKIKTIFFLRITTMTVARYHVNLWYITVDEKFHYVLVKYLSRLVSSQYNNFNGKWYFCQYCRHGCTSEEILKNHLERSKSHGTRRIKFPEVGDKKGRDKVKFTKTEYQLRLPFYLLWILKMYHVNKTLKWRRWKVFGTGPSRCNHL